MLTNLTILAPIIPIVLFIVIVSFIALIYFELQNINKQVLEIQEQIHFLNNEVSRLKQQAKKKYYPAQNKKQVIKG